MGGASLAEILAAIAIVASIVTFTLNLHTQQDQAAATRIQNDRGLLLQLRSGYSQISDALAHGNSSELETALTVSTGLLRSLPPQEIGAGDYYFLAHSYQQDNFPERALPLYRKAIADATQPSLRSAARRALAVSEAQLEDSTAANQAMDEAAREDARLHEPWPVTVSNEFNNERVWTYVSGVLKNCAAAREHAERYQADLARAWPLFTTGLGATKEVEGGVASACGSS